MPEVVVSLDAETAEQLDVECELLGFDTRAEYLAWIVENRAAIDKGTERERLLSAYEERIEALERRLDELEALNGEEPRSDPSPQTEAAVGQSSTDASSTDPPQAEPDLRADGSEAGSGSDSTDMGDESGSTDDRPESRGLAGIDRIEGSASVPKSGTDDQPTDSAAEAGVEAMNLAPERVSRISGDTVSEDADVLSGVETDRLDELTRRAVAKTRKRLDRDVETGLSYRSTTSLSDSDVPTGDDITDLDGLELPGRSAETLHKRREAAGRALAFLRDEERARRSDFVDALYESCPAGYDTEDGWWNCIKQALKQVDAVDGGEGTRVWEFHQ